MLTAALPQPQSGASASENNKRKKRTKKPLPPKIAMLTDKDKMDTFRTLRMTQKQT